MFRFTIRDVLRLVAACSFAATCDATEWGNLSMRFTYDGEPPPHRRLQVDKDQLHCGNSPILDESLLVGADRGIANVVIFLIEEEGRPILVHPSYDASNLGEVDMQMKGCRFQPHVAVLRTSQTLVVENTDPIAYNPKIDALDNPSFSDVIPTGPAVKRTFLKPERTPIHISCSVHPWMSAWLVIRDNPYCAVSDEHGAVTLSQLPTGHWRFRVWHERCGWISKAIRNGTTEDWDKGHVRIKVDDRENHLGEIKLGLEKPSR